jgi:hypothetical protein
LLITPAGKIIDLPGGSFFYDAKSERLYSRHDTDIEPLITVLEGSLEIAAASVNPDNLIDRKGRRIPAPPTYYHLGELADAAGTHPDD